MGRILIVQTAFLGDIILATPLVPILKELHPDSELFFLTTPAGKGLVEREPLLSGVITFDKRKGEKGALGILRMAKKLREYNFEKVYSLHKSYRTSLLLLLAGIKERIGFSNSGLSFLYSDRCRVKGDHAVERNLSLLGKDRERFEDEADLQLFSPKVEELSEEARKGSEQLEDQYVAIVPGSAWKTKMWSTEGYNSVARSLSSEGRKIVILGGPGEEEIGHQVAEGTDALVLSGKISLSDSMYILEGASLLICNDSMALHMGSAFKVPTVAIFCATSPKFGFGPWKNRALVVEKKGLDCKPCGRHGGNRCPTGTEACMKDLAPAEVLAAANWLLG